MVLVRNTFEGPLEVQILLLELQCHHTQGELECRVILRNFLDLLICAHLQVGLDGSQVLRIICLGVLDC